MRDELAKHLNKKVWLKREGAGCVEGILIVEDYIYYVNVLSGFLVHQFYEDEVIDIDVTYDTVSLPIIEVKPFEEIQTGINAKLALSTTKLARKDVTDASDWEMVQALIFKAAIGETRFTDISIHIIAGLTERLRSLGFIVDDPNDNGLVRVSW